MEVQEKQNYPNGIPCAGNVLGPVTYQVEFSFGFALSANMISVILCYICGCILRVLYSASALSVRLFEICVYIPTVLY